MLVLGVAWLAGGCSAVIVPPQTAGRDVVPVLVADYGYHSTLIFPRSQGGGLMEYAYGDWSFFAQSQKSFGNALHALFASDQATLGRRVLERSPDEPGIIEATGAKYVVRFDAPREQLAEIERALEERFSTRPDTGMYSPVHDLHFVKDDERYGLLNNCNHFTARLLERIGCRVEWFVGLSNFRVKTVAP